MVVYRSRQKAAQFGRVVELVDSLDSGSSVHCGRAGSSPASPTKEETSDWMSLLFCFQERDLNRTKCNSPVELYECGIRCYFLVFCGLFPYVFYDMVTAARCPRTGIVPRNRAEVKHAFCSVSWQTAELLCAPQSAWNSRAANKGQRKIAAPLYLRMRFRCIMRVYLRNATLQLWCNPWLQSVPPRRAPHFAFGKMVRGTNLPTQFIRPRCHYIGVPRAGSTIPPPPEGGHPMRITHHNGRTHTFYFIFY